MLILLLAIMIESSGNLVLHRPCNVTVHMMHYIDDILQTGHVKKAVANAYEVSVKCYRIKCKSNGDSGN